MKRCIIKDAALLITNQVEFSNDSEAQPWVDKNLAYRNQNYAPGHTGEIIDITAEKQAERDLIISRRQDLRDQLLLLKNTDWPATDTVAELKAIVRIQTKLIIHLIREALREE